MKFDVATLIAGATIFGWLLAAVFFAMHRSMPASIRGLRTWAVTFLVFGLAALLFVLRGNAPEFVTIVLANTVFVAGNLLLWAGLMEFLGRSVPWRWLGAIVLAVFAVVWRYSDLERDFALRVVLTTLPEAIAYSHGAYRLLRARQPGWRIGAIVTSGSLAAVVVVGVMRILMTLAEGEAQPLLGFTGIHLLSVIVRTVAVVAIGTGMIMMAQERLRDELEFMSRHDTLTGVYNRRMFFDLAEREFARARRAQRPVSVLMLDLDHFKQLNDEFGHLAGDRVLAAAVETMKVQLRSHDVLARYGGEEFVVLLPDTREADAVVIAERIRAAFSGETAGERERQARCTVSIGVACSASGSADVNELLGRSDEAMYEAKRAGRDRVAARSGVVTPAT